MGEIVKFEPWSPLSATLENLQSLSDLAIGLHKSPAFDVSVNSVNSLCESKQHGLMKRIVFKFQVHPCYREIIVIKENLVLSFSSSN